MPSAIMSATYQVLPSGEIFTSCGIAPSNGSFCWPMTFIFSVSTLSSSPENSQETMKYRPSGEKSAWLTPPQLTGSVLRISMVCGSRKTSCRSIEAITMAYFPLGVK